MRNRVAASGSRVAEGSGLVRFRGFVETLSDDDRLALFDRSTSSDAIVRARTAEIIGRVRADDDAALVSMAREFDGVELEALEVPRAAWDAALDGLQPSLRAAMERSARNIAAAHRAFLPRATEVETEPGVIVGRRPDPLQRVGVYAPGGRAAYPSSVLMGVVPARVVGVGEVVVCSPPGPSGLPSDVVLAAAALGGADRVFAVGGAGAIAAMAYGTATVPRVDRIVGPGNAWVAEAKLQVAGAVAIDAPAGPSELLVIADFSADPALVARELLAQAEHDPRAAVVAVVIGEEQAEEVCRALDFQLGTLARRGIAAQALAGQSGVLVAQDYDHAVAFANEYAAEHLLLVVHEVEQAALLARLRNAGTVFVGDSSSVAFGDYMTGANHVLPTGGLARSYSGLSTLEFVRWTTWQRVTRGAAAALADDVATFAEAEGLPAHAAAARCAAGSPVAGRGPHRDGVESTGVGVGAGSREPSGESRRSRRPGGAAAARPAYRDISLYAPNRAPCAIDLSDNTNLWGMPPHAERVLREQNVAAVTRYPSLYAGELKQALADYLGVAVDMIVTGCGSDDVLDSAVRALAQPGDRLAIPDPSFAMLPIFARMNALEPVLVPLVQGTRLDPDAMLGTGAGIIYLCSPNNPTGNRLDADAVARVVREAPGVVIVDEAYAEFADGDVRDLLRESDRLLVCRTLSKAFGMAGLRIGYMAGAPALVTEVEKSRGPYKVSAIAERAALAALRDDMAWVRRHVAEAVRIRGRLADALRARGLAPLPSDANFVLVPVSDATGIAARMRTNGVAVRPFPALPHIGDALRISVGPWAMVERAIEELEAAL